MKKWVKRLLQLVGLLILLVVLAGMSGWWWLNSTFLTFEKKYPEKKEFVEKTVNGYRFLDRNNNGKLDIYEDARQPIAARVADVLAQMTLEEKIHLLKGSGMASGTGRLPAGEGIPGAVGTIVPTPRLGLPTIYLSDGPAGLRIQPNRPGESRTYYCTAFPIGTLLASSWNTELVESVGHAMGNEALEYGLDVILGPGANIHRHPLCGRNFEYYSEDPVLTGWIGAAMVNGIESNGVGTSVKHFVANNQETNRNFNDVRISERALREIYLKGFEIIVQQSQPWTIMSSYNLLNGIYTSESKRLLTEILRNEWHFEGLVMSDWFGGQHAAAQIAAGNDLLEPGTNRQWKALKKASKNGTLTEAEIDLAASRIIRLILSSKKMEGYAYSNNPDLKAHAAVTRQAAAEGMVLLKNEQVLPLADQQRIALLGVTSFDFIAGGTGSGDVNEAYTISLEEGLQQAGLKKNSEGIQQAGFQLNSQAKAMYEAHRKANPEGFVKPQGLQAMFQPYNPPQLNYTDAQLKSIAENSDIGIITIGRNSGEGGDRREVDDFLLTSDEKSMIEKVCRVFHKAHKKVVVVLNIGGVIETASWKSLPDAILLAWQGGQEGGNSVADILSGKVNPSGKLPMTFPIQLNDHASNAHFPLEGKPMSMWDMVGSHEVKPKHEQQPNIDFTDYAEGIYVGYRHFDKAGKTVSFPFGYGLSYSQFEFTRLENRLQGDTLQISFSIRNVGTTPGKEVAQVYISLPNSKIDRPVQELKAFAKTKELAPLEIQEIQCRIPVADLRYWDEKGKGWRLEKGSYEVRVGASSRDIRHTRSITIRQ